MDHGSVSCTWKVQVLILSIKQPLLRLSSLVFACLFVHRYLCWFYSKQNKYTQSEMSAVNKSDENLSIMTRNDSSLYDSDNIVSWLICGLGVHNGCDVWTLLAWMTTTSYWDSVLCVSLTTTGVVVGYKFTLFALCLRLTYTPRYTMWYYYQVIYILLISIIKRVSVMYSSAYSFTDSHYYVHTKDSYLGST